jgi:hypothetical protein
MAVPVTTPTNKNSPNPTFLWRLQEHDTHSNSLHAHQWHYEHHLIYLLPPLAHALWDLLLPSLESAQQRDMRMPDT